MGAVMRYSVSVMDAGTGLIVYQMSYGGSGPGALPGIEEIPSIKLALSAAIASLEAAEAMYDVQRNGGPPGTAA
jgi:hypothetical protein